MEEHLLNGPVSIVGAGIGGLTAALALKQNGVDALVFERAAKIAPVGGGIAMASNAMQLFRKMGVSEAIGKAGNKISHMKITDERLRVLSEIDLSGYERKYSVGNVAIHRADLLDILIREVGEESIRLSKHLDDLKEQNGQYELTFGDRTTFAAGVVIGADGIKSTVRSKLFGSGVIRDAGQVCWRGVCETDLSKKYKNQACEAWGRGKRFGFVGLGGRRVYWYGVVSRELLTDEYGLSTLFDGFHRDVLELIDLTPFEDVFRSEIADLKPFAEWHKGGVCLLGDAAHASTPNMGQGACQAIEDAYILGRLLGQKRSTSVSEVFSEYEKFRVKKAHYVVKKSRIIGSVSHWKSGAGVWLRNNFMRCMPDFLAVNQLSEVFRLGY